MTRSQKSAHRAFVGQALLILVPLLALAVFASLSLQQDRRMARHAAVQFAQSIADRMLPALWSAVENAAEQKGPLFSIDAAGDLASPRPVPEPDELFSNRSVEAPGTKLYRTGLQQLRTGAIRDAVNAFSQVATRFPTEKGETGLPLGPLAELKLLEIQSESSIRFQVPEVSIESLCSNLVTRPTPLTPFLLDRAEVLSVTPGQRSAIYKWRALWSRDENARELFRTCHQSLGDLRKSPSVAVVLGGLYLVRIQSHDADQRFTVLDSADLLRRFDAVINSHATPVYLRPVVQLGPVVFRTPEAPAFPGRGDPLTTTSATLPETPELLAFAVKREQGAELLRVNMMLVDSALLYRQQRIRSLSFGAFVAAASVVALFGLGGAWRSFRQQAQLNEMKSNFVSSVSHELRAPIASVRLMAENLEGGKIPDETRRMEYFRFISQECRRLSSLIENVLDFSRIEQGRKQYEFELCDLTRVIDSTEKLMQPVAGEKGVTVSRALSAAVPPVVADAKALQQALVNLVDNAVKHSVPGANVELGLDTAENKRAVLLSVEDYGEGIPEAEHERIFERFYRRGSELRRDTQGVGIGLSIVKHIVEAHQGRIHVRSAPGQGSRFTIELPVDLEQKPRSYP